jgi:hypothetical protein
MELEKTPAVARIDLAIKQDWTAMIGAFDDIKNKVRATPLEKKHRITDGYTLIVSDWDRNWCFYEVENYPGLVLKGKILESFLHWITQMQTDMREIGLFALSFVEISGCVSRHVDNGECTLNYIITDCGAVTYLDNDGTIECYPSKGGTAWLIDTLKPHWIENMDKRYTLQLGFKGSFDETLAWFRSRPAFVYDGTI